LVTSALLIAQKEIVPSVIAIVARHHWGRWSDWLG